MASRPAPALTLNSSQGHSKVGKPLAVTREVLESAPGRVCMRPSPYEQHLTRRTQYSGRDVVHAFRSLRMDMGSQPWDSTFPGDSRTCVLHTHAQMHRGNTLGCQVVLQCSTFGAPTQVSGNRCP